MVEHLKAKAARASRKAGLLTGGLLAIIAGLGFLSWAAWFYLSLQTDPLTASIIVGAVYMGLGLVMVGVAVTSSADNHQHSSDHAAHSAVGATGGEQPPLMQAFMYGMQAGASAQRK